MITALMVVGSIAFLIIIAKYIRQVRRDLRSLKRDWFGGQEHISQGEWERRAEQSLNNSRQRRKQVK